MNENEHTHSKQIRRLKIGSAAPSVLDLLVGGARYILVLLGIAFFTRRWAGGIGRHFDVLLIILLLCERVCQ